MRLINDFKTNEWELSLQEAYLLPFLISYAGFNIPIETIGGSNFFKISIVELSKYNSLISKEEILEVVTSLSDKGIIEELRLERSTYFRITEKGLEWQFSISSPTSKKKKRRSIGKEGYRKILIDVGVDENHIEDWFAVKDKKRSPYTRTPLKAIFDECKKHNITVADAIETCARRGWIGFKYNWYINDKNNGIQQTERSSQLGELERLAGEILKG